MAQVDWLWMNEDELRGMLCLLADLLRQSELRRVVCMNEALQHGYREGFADGALQLTSKVEKGNAEGAVLH